jgi:uncharacterized SAM-binding protein YcdF (DUF218 family)
MQGTSRRRTFARRVLVLFGLLVVAGAVWLLNYGGRFLQHEDPLQRADAIFVLAGTRVERPLEAVDLYKEGWAPRIVLSPGRPEPAERLARARGIRVPSDSELSRDVIQKLGVPASAIVAVDGYVDNTAQEANLLRAMVIANHWHRVIVVTSKYHVRRAGFAFRRGLADTPTTLIMRASRYDPSDPAHWWRSRADVRFAGSEWEKLILYWLGVAA